VLIRDAFLFRPSTVGVPSIVYLSVYEQISKMDVQPKILKLVQLLQVFGACCLWRWFGHLPAVLRYVAVL